MLRCLTDHRAELKSESCKQEVLYFQKMEVTDFRCVGWGTSRAVPRWRAW